MRSWWEDRGLDRDLQERYLLGAGDGTTATIPFWHRGRVKGIIRRKLKGEPKYLLPAAEDLVDGHRPLFIPGPVGSEIFLVEGYIDALAVTATGRSVVAVGGTNASEEQLAELDKFEYLHPPRPGRPRFRGSDDVGSRPLPGSPDLPCRLRSRGL